MADHKFRPEIEVLAAADVPSIASELEIVKARAARASQDANTVSEALLEVRELANSMERLSDDCAEDAKRVHDRCEHVDQTYARFKEALAQTDHPKIKVYAVVNVINIQSIDLASETFTCRLRLYLMCHEILLLGLKNRLKISL